MNRLVETTRRVLWTRADWAALALITLAAAALRIIRLGEPSSIIFDETYYAKDACWYVKASATICEVEQEQTQVHPPLGKWILAIGIRLFGYDSFGWRISAAVVGALTVALVYVLARKVLDSTLGASFASGLLAVDFLHFVQSRIAMLDIFVTFFTVAVFVCLAFDRDRWVTAPEPEGEPDEPPPERRARLLDRPWRIAAGVCAGAALASKWSGIFALFGAVVISAVWEVSARRRAGLRTAVRGALRSETWSILISFLVLPLLIYVGTFAGRLDGTLLAAPWSEESWFRDLWDQQFYMLNFHKDLTSTHSYQSPPWSWIILKRPVAYDFASSDGTDYREIIALGNPFVWWTSILAIAYVTWNWVRHRDIARAEGLILAGFAFNYLPWLLPLVNRPAVFLFYLLPTLPFMCLALGYVATRIGRSWEARAAQAIFALGAVGLFAFYYPILAKTSLNKREWERRMWVFDNSKWCEKPEGTPTTELITETIDEKVTVSTNVTTSNDSLPPKGWCWI